MLKRMMYRYWFMFLLWMGQMIKVDDRHRGIGKTTMMIKHAQKHEKCIVVGTQIHYDLIKSLGFNEKRIVRLAKGLTLDIVGNHFPNGVVIDESVDPELMIEIEGRHIKHCGFLQNYKGK